MHTEDRLFPTLDGRSISAAIYAENWRCPTKLSPVNLAYDTPSLCREPVRDYVLISKSTTGEWDQGVLLQGQGFENVGDKTYIYCGS